MIASRSTYISANVISFYGCVIFHYIYMYHIFFIYSPVDGRLGYLHVLPVVNNSAVHWGKEK